MPYANVKETTYCGQGHASGWSLLYRNHGDLGMVLKSHNALPLIVGTKWHNFKE